MCIRDSFRHTDYERHSAATLRDSQPEDPVLNYTEHRLAIVIIAEKICKEFFAAAVFYIFFHGMFAYSVGLFV